MSDQPTINLVTPWPDLEKFVTASQHQIGVVGQERRVWNNVVSADAVRHFALGTSDENPLWLDPGDANETNSPGGVPPAFVLSVRYPVLHGAPVKVPLENWISRAEFRWQQPMRIGDQLAGQSRLEQVLPVNDRPGQPPRVQLVTDTSYVNEDDQRIADVSVTLFRTLAEHDGFRIDRQCYRYDEAELQAIKDTVLNEQRRGIKPFELRELEPGSQMATRARGPLNIGDLVAWNAAIGPAAASGSWAWRDCLASPHSSTTHPVTGAPLKGSLQHEDPLLCGQRGMPLPFDNGMMRIAWLMPLVTDWVGHHGQLKRLVVEISRPNLYGDTTWYSGYVTAQKPIRDGIQLELKLGGVNQLGERTVRGEATVEIPDCAIVRPRDVIRIADHLSYLTDETTEESIDIVARVEEFAIETPGKIALTDSTGRQFSYRDLAKKICAVAGWLQSLGISPGDRVAIAWPRDVCAAILPLATLRAGATWIACEPDWPVNRLMSVLADAQARLVLTDNRGAATIPEGPWQVATFDLDLIDQRPAQPALPSDAAAYICFTSGSAGRPTGVVVSRTSFGRYLSCLAKWFPISQNDRFSHTASFAFSASTRQMFLPLAMGATLCIADNSHRQDPRRLMQWMDNEDISVWDTVPSVWQAVMDVHAIGHNADPHPVPARLKHIFLTGEPLHWKTVQQWRTEWGRAQEIFNLYSQTETAGTAAVYRVPEEIALQDGFVPIGSALPGIQLHLTGDDGRRLAIGQTGRIVVVSNRLADGYLSNDSQNDRFQAAAGQQPARFTTGDLGCLDAQGQISIVGRADRRIKRRGFRIDLSEIESYLLKHPRINEAAVTVANVSTHGQLVAHVGTDHLTAEKIRKYLDQQLPGFMMPNQIVVHGRLPRTASGKVAYQQLSGNLPDPEAVISPRNAIEYSMHEIWTRLLDRTDIQVTDDFFELGGDSLLVPMLLAELEKQLGQLVEPGTIYQHPRLEDFSRAVSQAEDFNEVVEIRSGDRPAVFTFPVRSGDSVYVRHVLPGLSNHLAICCLQPRMEDLIDGDCTDFREAAVRCATAIQKAQPRGPYRLMGYSFAGMLAFETACLLQQAGETVDGLILLDSATPQLYRLRRTIGYRSRRGWKIFHQLNDQNLDGYWARRWRRYGNSLVKRIRHLARTSQPDNPEPVVRQRNRDFFTTALINHRFSRFQGTIDLVQATRIRFLDIEPEANGWLEFCDDVRCHPVDATHENLLQPESAPAIAAVIDAVAQRTSTSRLRAA